MPLTIGDVVEIRGPLSITGGRASRLSRPELHPEPGERFTIRALDFVDAFVQSTTDPDRYGAIQRASIARPD